MSRVVRKLTFCICENKDADQLCGILTVWTPKFFAVSYLKFKQKGQTLGHFVKIVQRA